eukprot:7326668-Prymnesium_polylepis.1
MVRGGEWPCVRRVVGHGEGRGLQQGMGSSHASWSCKSTKQARPPRRGAARPSRGSPSPVSSSGSASEAPTRGLGACND